MHTISDNWDTRVTPSIIIQFATYNMITKLRFLPYPYLIFSYLLFLCSKYECIIKKRSKIPCWYDLLLAFNYTVLRVFFMNEKFSEIMFLTLERYKINIVKKITLHSILLDKVYVVNISIL